MKQRTWEAEINGVDIGKVVDSIKLGCSKAKKTVILFKDFKKRTKEENMEMAVDISMEGISYNE